MSRRLQALVFVSAAAVFIFLIYHAGLPGLLRTLAEAKWAILPSVLAWGVVYVLNTIAWRRVMGNAVPFGRAYAINVASFAINYVTPVVALGGEPFRVAAATPWVGAARSAASVVSFRVIHTLGQILFWISAMPLAFLLLPHSRATTLSLVVLTAAFTTIFVVLGGFFRHGFVVRLLDGAARVPVLRIAARRLEPRRAALIGIDEQLTAMAVHDRRSIYIALGAEYLGRAVSMLEYLFIARAMGLEIDYLTAFTIGAFAQFITNVTFFVPFELGSKEGGLSLIFHLLGLPADLGVYASIVSRIREMIWIAIGLTLVWVTTSRSADTTPPSR